jgi:hypothetical protein
MMPKECEIRAVQTLSELKKGNYNFYLQQFIDGKWRSIPEVDPETGALYERKKAKEDGN